MRIALVGLGGAATHGHLPALRSLEAEGRLRLVAAADQADTSRRRAKAILDDTPLFVSTEKMLTSVRADVLVIATEPSSHAELIELGCGRGMHVVCEKPLAHTERDRATVQALTEGSNENAIVSVHQYRYAQTWVRLMPWIRCLNTLQLPFSILVEVWRSGVEDPHAASSWRVGLDRLGGVLADHAAHFLALAWTIDPELSVLAGERVWASPGQERSWAKIGLGSGVLELRVSTASSTRQTRLKVAGLGLTLDWQERRVALRLARRRLAAWNAGALSDRSYLDSLYLDLYRDLIQNLPDRAWRAKRTAESLAVGTVLVELLERLAD